MRFVLVVVLGWSACANRASTPADTILAYRDALVANDANAAYKLLAPAVHKTLDLRTFTERWRNSAEERLRLIAALRPDIGAEEQAQVRLSDGRTLELTRTNQGWRVRSPRPLPAKVSSPEALLLELARVLHERNAPRLLDLLSDELRALLEQKLQARLSALRARPQGRLEVGADRMRVRFGSYYLELVERDGTWRIADFN